MTWTQEDEQKLKELEERKQAYINVLKNCVDNAVDTYLSLPYTVDAEEITCGLIEHATVFRKVLEPFDKELMK